MALASEGSVSDLPFDDEDKTPPTGSPQDVMATDSRKLKRDSVSDRMRTEKFFGMALQGLCANPAVINPDRTLPCSFETLHDAMVDAAWDIAIAAANGFAEEGWD